MPHFIGDFVWLVIICVILGFALGVMAVSFRVREDFDGPACCKPKRVSRVALAAARLGRWLAKPRSSG